MTENEKVIVVNTVGIVPQFVLPNKVEWLKFKDKLEMYFEANMITDDKRKRAILLSSTGELVFDIVNEVNKDKKLTELKLAEVYEIMDARFEATENKFIRGSLFAARIQKHQEPIREYVAELRRLAEGCGFSEIEDAILKQVVKGIHDEGMQKSLLLAGAGSALNLKKAVEKIAASEEADVFLKQMREMQIKSRPEGVYMQREETNKEGDYEEASETVHGEIHKATAYRQHFRPQPSSQQQHTPALLAAAGGRQQRYFPEDSQGRSCYHCGNNHTQGSCPAFGKQCTFCRKYNHFRKVCKALQRSEKKGKGFGVNNNYVTSDHSEQPSNTEESKSHFTSYLYNLRYKKQEEFFKLPPPPMMTTVYIENVKISMEIDTGSGFSLIGFDTYCQYFSHIPLEKTNLILNSWSNETLPVAGQITVQVVRNNYTASLPMIVMKKAGPSLMGRWWLTKLGIQLQHSFHMSMSGSVEEQLPPKLKEFGDIFSPGIGKYTGPPVHIHVKKDAIFKFCKARTVPLAFQEAARTYLDANIKQGVYTPVRYAALGMATPGLVVPKSDGTIRYVGDYSQTVNKVCEKEVYPLPTVEEILSQLAGCKHYIKLDLANAFLQVTVDAETAQLLTMNTHKGLVEVNRLCPGLSAAPNIFQRLMENLLIGSGRVVVYLDDILMGAETLEELWQTASKVLEILREAGFKLSIAKCLFAVQELDFVGYHISGKGVQPTQGKVEAVLNAPSPSKKEELEVYLGAINYYDRFFPNKAENFAPLYQLLHSESKWSWTNVEEQSITYAKNVLASREVLIHFTPTLPIVLATDAGPNGVGVVLSHILPDGSERPIAYASRTLRGSERNYSQLDKEGLAVVFAVVKFNYWLLGREFTITTDNLPLTGIFRGDKGIPEVLSPRMLRWCLLLSNYNYKIQHRPGKHHANADFFSRMPLPSKDTDFVFPEPAAGVLYLQQAPEGAPIRARCIAEATSTDPKLAKIRDVVQFGAATTGLPEEIQTVLKGKLEQFTVMDGCILRGDCVVIPVRLQPQVLQMLHKNHQGIVKTKQIARSYVWWPTINDDIEEMVHLCAICQSQRKSPPKVPTSTWPKTEKPWQRLHIDFAGPCNGKTFLILIDSYSKWVEVAETGGSLTAGTTIKNLKRWFAAHGLPAELVSDNAACFLSHEFQTYLKSNMIKHTTSAPVYPATNGQAERTVQTVKNMLQKVPVDEWEGKLPEVLFALRTTPTSDGRSPAELLNGRKLVTMFDKMHPTYEAQGVRRSLRQPETLPPSRTFNRGDRVLYRNYGRGEKWKEGKVAQVLGTRYFYITTGCGKYQVHRHINQLLKVRSQTTVLLPVQDAPMAEDVEWDGNRELEDHQDPLQELEPQPPPVVLQQQQLRGMSTREKKIPARFQDYQMHYVGNSINHKNLVHQTKLLKSIRQSNNKGGKNCHVLTRTMFRIV